jgi:hypothetical protein
MISRSAYNYPYHPTSKEFEEFCKENKIPYEKKNFGKIKLIKHQFGTSQRVVKFAKEFYKEGYNTWTDDNKDPIWF